MKVCERVSPENIRYWEVSLKSRLPWIEFMAITRWCVSQFGPGHASLQGIRGWSWLTDTRVDKFLFTHKDDLTLFLLRWNCRDEIS